MQMQLHSDIENKFNKILKIYNGDYNALFSNSINYYITELQRGINNIKIDLDYFEKKYSINTEKFIENYENGELGDENDDFLQWSGEYAIYLENKKKLSELS
jgi:hypothetical protein